MAKMLFVVNPTAGGGRTKSLIGDIEKIMDKTNIEYKITLTQKPKDGIRISREGVEKGYNTIVAVGGDGTANEVAVGILESGKGTLGIIPSGTGNDLARSLNIPLKVDKAMKLIIDGNKKDIDIGIVNNNLFLNIASIGFDAEVVRNTQKIKENIKSSIAYTISVIYTFVKFKNKRIRLEIDDKPIEKDVFLVAIGSGKYYGGGIKILPMASIEDGYFYICIIKNVSKLKFLYSFPTVLRGNHEKLKDDVEFFKAKKVKVTTEDKTYLNIDGEIHDIDRETLFTMSNKKIGIIC